MRAQLKRIGKELSTFQTEADSQQSALKFSHLQSFQILGWSDTTTRTFPTSLGPWESVMKTRVFGWRISKSLFGLRRALASWRQVTQELGLNSEEMASQRLARIPSAFPDSAQFRTIAPPCRSITTIKHPTEAGRMKCAAKMPLSASHPLLSPPYILATQRWAALCGSFWLQGFFCLQTQYW